MFLTISLAIVYKIIIFWPTHPSKRRLSRGRQHVACYVAWAALLSAVALISHTLSFYFSNVIGLVQQIFRFVMRTELFQLTKEEQPLLSLFHNVVNVSVPLQVLRDGGSQEPEWLHCSHSAVHDGEWGECRGVSPEVHYHLYSFERVQLQVVVTSPDSQLLNLLSVSRLVSVLDETDDCGVICKL